MQEPLVSISILNWNGKKMTAECLKSLKKLKYQNYEVIVVDNGSKDGSVEFLKKNFPEINLVCHKENKGFTGGHNATYRVMRGKYLCLLNNDMVVDPSWLKNLVKVIEEDPKIGACEGGTFKWNKDYPVYNKNNPLQTIRYINKYTGFPWQEKDHEEFKEADYLSGGATLIRKDLIDRIGLFDNRFFAYVEDRDLSARMKRAGYKTMYVPQAFVWHKGSATAKKVGYLANYWQYRNHLFFLFKNFDRGYLQLALLLYLLRELKATAGDIIKRGWNQNHIKARIVIFFWFFSHLILLLKMRRESRKLFPSVRYNRLIGNYKGKKAYAARSS